MVPNHAIHHIYSDVFGTLSDVYDGAFCENSELLKVAS